MATPSRLFFTAETKALGCHKVVGVPAGEGQPLFERSERPTVEGTSSAVEPVSFRERAGETALQGRSGESSACLVDRFERGRFRTTAECHSLPGGVRHRFMTRGVRVKQVGVNPLGRAVVPTGGSQRIARKAPPGLWQLG
jgi:hypothetical protein